MASANIIFSSICLLCGIRLKFVLELDPSDPTWTVVNFGLFGAIEPMLGIISASLPILPPVILKLKDGLVLFKKQPIHTRRGPANHSKNLQWVDGVLRTEHPNTSHFNRLDDNLYSLKDNPHSRSRFLSSNSYDARTERTKDPENAIRVTTDLLIQSKPELRAP